jgi:uncharacterized protein YcbK (DUF882 family)
MIDDHDDTAEPETPVDDGSTGRKARQFGRRQLFKWTAAATLAGSAALTSRLAQASIETPLGLPSDVPLLSFLNVHTTARLSVPIAGGLVTPEALGEVRQLLHDHHDGTLHDIDPRLLTLLSSLMGLVGGLVGGAGTIHVLSGYRSPHTNSVLRQSTEGVAPNSYHMRGQAIDFWVPGVPLETLHHAALSIRGGGVGYYPAHNFLHVDVGPVRQWGGFGGIRHDDWLPNSGGGSAQVMIDGRPMHLTRIQARKLAMHRRALAFFRRQRHHSGV